MNPYIFRELIRSKSGIMVNKMLLSRVGPEMAVFISDLADRDSYFSRANETYDGWFFSKKDKRSIELGLSEKSLQRLMSAAVEAGYVETCMKGQPALQWIRVNYEVIYCTIDESFSLPQNVQASIPLIGQASVTHQGQAIYNHTNSNLTNIDFKHIVPPPKSSINRPQRTAKQVTPVEPVEDPDEPFKKIANQLMKIMSRHHPNNKITPAQLKSWVKPIKAIFRTFTGTPEQISEWLQLYYIHFDRSNKYHVVIMSGESLKEKWPKLEGFANSIRRELNRNKPEVQQPLPNIETPKRKFHICDPNADFPGRKIVDNFDD